MNEFELSDALDAEILMHRDAHFGGSFDVMLDYYKKRGKGVHADFELKRIKALKAIEVREGQDLSELLLSDQEKQEVEQAKKAYHSLRDLYERELPSDLPRLVADLILSEEEEPAKEIAALKAKGKSAGRTLIDLISSDDFYNPLFPGYGQAPAAAARCLGQIGDESAIIPLFAAMGRNDFFSEEAFVEALSLIGTPAKKFLSKVVVKKPINQDNEHAAIALLAFKEDPEVAKLCLQMLQDENVRAYPIFAAYLILGCTALSTEREAFKALANLPDLNSDLRQEMREVIKQWR